MKKIGRYSSALTAALGFNKMAACSKEEQEQRWRQCTAYTNFGSILIHVECVFIVKEHYVLSTVMSSSALSLAYLTLILRADRSTELIYVFLKRPSRE